MGRSIVSTCSDTHFQKSKTFDEYQSISYKSAHSLSSAYSNNRPLNFSLLTPLPNTTIMTHFAKRFSRLATFVPTILSKPMDSQKMQLTKCVSPTSAALLEKCIQCMSTTIQREQTIGTNSRRCWWNVTIKWSKRRSIANLDSIVNTRCFNCTIRFIGPDIRASTVRRRGFSEISHQYCN